jgi:SecD/SecF fusion protein
VNFIGGRKVTYIISGVIVVLGALALNPHFFGKLNLGIDFSGGRNYIVRFAQDVNTEEVNASLDNVFMAAKAELNDEESFALNVITIGNANQVRISTNYLINDNSENVEETIEALLYEGCKPFLAEDITLNEFTSTEINPEVGIMQSQKVGPAVADDIKQSAVLAVLAALVAIFLYVLLRFRNFAFSVGALTGLAHNTLIVLGAYALLWKIMPFSMEIDQSFIAAILTVVGYSINATVVIFDRVREFTTLYPKRDLKQNINDAINNTLSRTFSTSMSTLVVLLAIFTFGGETIQGFVFALLMGVIVGTFSSLFIASPIAYNIYQAQAKRAEKKAALKK